MAEVWTGLNIKRPYSILVGSLRPLLERLDLFEPAKLERHIRTTGRYKPKKHTKTTFSKTVERAFEQAANPSNEGRYSRYAKHVELLLPRLEDIFRERVPIFINGECVPEWDDPKKMQRSPYSPRFLFTNQLLEVFNQGQYPLDFLQTLVPVFTQPIPFCMKARQDGETIILEDHLREELEEELGLHGALMKRDDCTPKQGYSEICPAALDLQKAFDSMEHDFYPEEGVGHRKTRLSYEVALDQHLMAMLYGQMIDTILNVADRKEFKELKLFMEKGSPSAAVLELAARYSKDARASRRSFLGNGIMSGTKDQMPTQGICSSTALGAFFGFLDTAQMIWSSEYSREARRRPNHEPKEPIVLRRCTNPVWLAENGMEKLHPNIEDLAAQILTAEQQQIVNRFAESYGLGFAGIEARLAQLFTRDQDVYMGVRNLSDITGRWYAEIEGKQIVTPAELGFIETGIREGFVDRSIRGDFRGSELCQIAPIIDGRWIRDWEEGRIDAGCSIAKMIRNLVNQPEVISRGLEHANEEERELYARMQAQRPAERGTAIHAVTGDDMPDGTPLVHYETLRLIGVEPQPRSNYCETPLVQRLNMGGEEFTATMHPDCYLFLKRDELNYDLLIMDHKTTRVLPYIEHKYLQQFFFYGTFIKRLAEKHLGIKVQNIYGVLNKNAFYKGFGGEEVHYPAGLHRQQRFTPITKFTPDDIMHDIMQSLVGQIVREKRELRADADKFLDHKRRQARCGRCDHCYLEKKWACDYAAAEIQAGNNPCDIIS